MQLPETGFLRESQILPQREVTEEQAARNRESGRGKRSPRPASPGLVPVSHAHWWRGVKEGRFPKPIKLSSRVSVWRVEDIRALLTNGIA